MTWFFWLVQAVDWVQGCPSELNFHIWNANSQSFAWAKSEARMAAHGGKFCTSVPVLYTTLIFSFTLVRLRKHSQTWKKCSDEILLGQFYINKHLKVFITAVWPNKCAKLSKGGKLTVKSGRAFSNFLKSLFRTVLSGFSLVWYFIFVKT